MRLISRLLLVCIFCCLLVVLIQLHLLSFWNCNNCWALFDYDADSPTNTTVLGQQGVLSKQLPSVLIIGAKKGGTRALIDALQLHPRIVAAKREVHFFDDDTLYQKGLDWYQDQMPLAGDNQIVIEKTPAYFSKHTCAKRVYNFNPDVKLIVIVREPLIRTISDFTQVQHTRLSKNLSLLNFEESAFKYNKTPNLMFKPVSNSIYVKHLGAWLNYFPLSQFLIVDGDKFIKDPMHELRKVETFLGLDHQIDTSQLVFNKRKGFYCFRAHQRRIPKCLGESKGRKHVEISARSQELLQQVFAAYNEQFFQLINRRFNW